MHRCVPQIAGYRLSRTIGVTPVEKNWDAGLEGADWLSFRDDVKHRTRNLEMPNVQVHIGE
jgi:hypothetical protein